MELKLYEIINLEEGIDELIKHELSFPFKISLSIMKNKIKCSEITDLFFKRMIKIFNDHNKLYDSSLRSTEETLIYNESLNSIIEIDIIQLSVNDITMDDNVKVELTLFNNLKPMLVDL